jgi:hypothetical protein
VITESSSISDFIVILQSIHCSSPDLHFSISTTDSSLQGAWQTAFNKVYPDRDFAQVFQLANDNDAEINEKPRPNF